MPSSAPRSLRHKRMGTGFMTSRSRAPGGVAQDAEAEGGRSAPLDGDTDVVLAAEEGVLVEARLVVEGIDGGAGLDLEPDVTAEVDRPRRVLGGREGGPGAAGRGADAGG